MKLNDADAVFVGDVAADRVYAGANLVWEKKAAFPDMGLLAFHNHGGPRSGHPGEVGFNVRMVVDVTVTFIGVYKNPYTGTRKVNIYDHATHELLRTAIADYASEAHTDNYIWLPVAPLTLVAGRRYAVLMEVAPDLTFENYGTCGPKPEYADDLYECYTFTVGGAFDGPTPGYQYCGLDLGWT